MDAGEKPHGSMYPTQKISLPLLTEYVKPFMNFPHLPTSPSSSWMTPSFFFFLISQTKWKPPDSSSSALLSVYRHPGTQVSRFLLPPVLAEEASGSLIALLCTVLWLLCPLLSQGPHIIVIILSLLYPPSLPLNWVFLIGIYMSPIFNFTNALCFTKPPLACFTNRR